MILNSIFEFFLYNFFFFPVLIFSLNFFGKIFLIKNWGIISYSLSEFLSFQEFNLLGRNKKYKNKNLWNEFYFFYNSLNLVLIYYSKVTKVTMNHTWLSYKKPWVKKTLS